MKDRIRYSDGKWCRLGEDGAWTPYEMPQKYLGASMMCSFLDGFAIRFGQIVSAGAVAMSMRGHAEVRVQLDRHGRKLYYVPDAMAVLHEKGWFDEDGR